MMTQTTRMNCEGFPCVCRMIVGVVAGLLFGRTGYYLTLLWCCISIFIFMVSSRKS